MLGKAKHPRAIVALCVLMVVAIAAVAYFESVQGSFGLLSGSPTSQIEGDYSSHLLNVHSMNVSAIEQDYANGASVQFTAVGQPSTGNYTGIKNIGIIYGADMFTNFAVPQFSHMNSTVKVAGDKATLDSIFLIQGYDSDANPQTAVVNAHVVYVHQGSDWLIAYESWSFTFQAPSTSG